MTKLWTVKITTFLLWSLAAGSATFWVLQHVNAGNPSVATQVAMPLPAQPQDVNLAPKVAAALGAKNAIPQTAAGALVASQARFQLQGVVSVANKNGAALISVDGKPAKPYRVGAAIEDGLEVIAIKAREASIGSKGVTAFTLELPLKK